MIINIPHPEGVIVICCTPLLEGVSRFSTPSKSGVQQTTIINEGNLYRLIIKSRMPIAEKFESWVCDEVLPQIRKTGSYSTDSTKPNPFDWTSDQILQLIKMAGNGNIYAIPVLEKIGYSFDIKDTTTPAQTQTKNLTQRSNDEEIGLKRFITENCNKKKNATVHNKVFREAYFQWCKHNKIPPYSVYKLTKNLRLMGHHSRVSSVREGGPKRTLSLYCGIELKFEKK